MAVTYDAPSATAKVYVDGVEKSSCGGFDTKPSNIELTHLVIGGSIFDDLYWTGELGCFRLYDRALRCVFCVYVCKRRHGYVSEARDGRGGAVQRV